jgi:hypothetical protein
MIAEGSDAHPQLGKGVPGFGRYYWRGFLDKTDGNYLVALPTVFHQDERYYAKGQGSFLKRFSYAVTRIVITPSLGAPQSPFRRIDVLPSRNLPFPNRDVPSRRRGYGQ